MSSKESRGASNKVRTPGPEPERLIIPGDWKRAVGESLTRGKPPKKNAIAKKKRRSK